MKRLRLRTIFLALLVTSGSSVIGVGLGRFLARTAFAREGPLSSQDGPAGGRTVAPDFAFKPVPFARADDLRGATGLRIIRPNPRDLPRRQPAPSWRDLAIASAGIEPVPTWNYGYSYVHSADKGSGSYSGTIVGRSPFDRVKTTTTIPVQIVPLVITIGDGTTTHTYDPTAVDPCVTGANGPYTDVGVITGSPIFQKTDWTMNGVSVGKTQYLDAFQRAQFWPLVRGTNYHLILDPTVLPAQSLTFSGGTSSGSGTNYDTAALFGGCGYLGVLNINDLDLAIQDLITGPLAGMVNVGTVPIFLLRNVVTATSGQSLYTDCCVLGYHSAYNVGPNLQLYSPFSLITSGIFPGADDVSILSHEMGELINDPSGNNPTPPWGNIGQTLGFCQTNFEVGDPLSPGFGTPTNPFVVDGNGLTYHMQELAFISWFYGGPPGAGGKYSNNGSFSGDANPCPPGGTK